jgi:hypothetical protein
MQLKQLSESLHGIANISETIQHRVSISATDEELLRQRRNSAPAMGTRYLANSSSSIKGF